MLQRFKLTTEKKLFLRDPKKVAKTCSKLLLYGDARTVNGSNKNAEREKSSVVSKNGFILIELLLRRRTSYNFLCFKRVYELLLNTS